MRRWLGSGSLWCLRVVSISPPPSSYPFISFVLFFPLLSGGCGANFYITDADLGGYGGAGFLIRKMYTTDRKEVDHLEVWEASGRTWTRLR